MSDYLRDSLFTEDLMMFFKNLGPPEWQFAKNVSKFENQIEKSSFSEEIGQAVTKMCRKVLDEIRACYEELLNKNVKDRGSFETYALKAAPGFFPEGYTHGSFLGYCAFLCGVAFYFFCFPDSGIPECSAEVLALVLFSGQLTGQFEKHGGWDGLEQVAKQFNMCLQEQ